MAHAACNLIPQAQPAFRGALGTIDRPFAAPGDYVDVRVRQTLCDVASPGIAGSASQHEVTLLFAPPGEARRAVVLTTDACASLTSRLDACEGASGMAKNGVSCVQVNQPGDPFGMASIFIGGENHLRFRFPDTDALLAPAGDRRGFTGPVTIAVSNAGATLPCGLATGKCAGQAGALGLVACVDDLYSADGTCQPNPGDTFSQFTALPVPNDFQADCFETGPPCTAAATELRFALDREGNLLFPVHWQGVLPSTVDKPIPRLLRGTVHPVVPITVPDRAFLKSFTPEGQPLPPIFEPQAAPTPAAGGKSVTFFGSADAPSTVLRIAHRRGRCSGGAEDGAACNVDAQCAGGGACVDACVGGANDGLACAGKKDCPDGVCGALYDVAAFRELVANGGPFLIPRVAAPAEGICQAEPFDICASNADCGPDPCVSYAFQAQDPVALESLTAGSDDVLALTAPESLAISDRTGDGDLSDTVLTVRNRVTGQTQPLGAPDGFAIGGAALPACGLTGTPAGRSLIRVPRDDFKATALATEGDVIAFIESENGEGFCDENGDGDRDDGILRVFTVPGNERTAGVTPPRALDPGLAVNEDSLAVSNGKVFFRSSEAAMAASKTERVSVASGLPGAEADGPSDYGSISKDGRWVAFVSSATNLIGPGADTNAVRDAFVRDRVTGIVTRVSVTSAGAETGGGVSGVGYHASISADGRFVAFDSDAPDVAPGDTALCYGGTSSCMDVFVRDRDSDENGVFDEPGGTTTTRVSLGPLGVEPDHHCERPVISANGKVVVFQSYATNLVADDTNDELDIFAWDADTGTVERVNVTAEEAENLGVQAEPRVYDVSDDGNYVLFDLRTTNLPNVYGHSGPAIDIFLRDRAAGETEQVVGEFYYGWNDYFPSTFAIAPQMSGDARYVVFFNEPDFSGESDVWVKDRLTGALEQQDLPVGDGGGPPRFSFYPSISDDGRIVSFWSNKENLIPTDGNGAYDLFVRDRLLGTIERANVVTGTGSESGGEAYWNPSTISGDGRQVLFVAGSSNLLGSTVDSNGSSDLFVHGVDAADPNDVDAVLFADGSLDDTVLEVLDAASGAITTLCPASQVAVANGRAAFLRPESASGTAACPGGSLNPDADVDVADQVVQLWPGTGAVQNLGKAATAVALGPTHVAAIVSETGQGVLAVHPVSGGGWTDVGQVADRVLACGAAFAVLTSEAAQGDGPLNGDGDDFDRVVQVYVPATDDLINLGQAAEEILCNDQILAFRTNEEAQNTNLIVGSGSAPWDAHDVIQAYDLGRPECLTESHPADCLRNSHQTVQVCDVEACDPRFPYKVGGTTVKFVTSECDQRGSSLGFCEVPGTDLNGDLETGDYILQIFDVRTGAVRVLAEVGGSENPFQGEAADQDVGTVLLSTGRCLEDLDVACNESTPCGDGALCVSEECHRGHRTCVTTLDCPPGATCEYVPGVVAASPDTDGDGVPDHIDDCIVVPNAAQTDADSDGIGDACDLATCGDGVRSYDESCETGDDAQCPGACVGCRCTVCGNVVVDPKAKVQLATKNGAGKLGAGVTLALSAYDDEPVTIALGDGDTPLIVRETLGALPPAGKAPYKKWVRKTKLKSGVVQVQLQKKGPGVYKLGLKAKRWFTAAAANQPAASTQLTVTIGTQCFRVAATKKTD